MSSPSRSLASSIATVAGVGYLPFAPGTWASLLALAASWGLSHMAGWQILGAVIPPLGALCALAVLGALWALPVVIAQQQKHSPARANIDGKNPDCQEWVIDEVIGQWLVLLCMPGESAWHYLGAFVLFRLFDICKPFPLRHVERMFPSPALNVIGDDVGAAFMALVCLYALDYATLAL